MSIHGVCYDNSQAGRCNLECELLREGSCCAEEEILEDVLECDHVDEEIKLELIDLYGDTMTEIEIKIECLYAKRYEVQLAILKPSEQGR